MILGVPSSARRIRRSVSGAAASPMSSPFISTPRTTATHANRTPMSSVPTASQRGLPVSRVNPTPTSAKNRPMSAAKSSSRTTGNSGILVCRTKPTQESPPRTRLDSRTTVRNDSDSKTTATTRTPIATPASSSSCGCRSFSIPS